MSRIMQRVVCLVGCLLVASGTLLWAQGDRGTITGTVSDPSGAVIVGASVTATNTATGVSTRTTTSSAGTYTIPLLRTGTYEVTVEQSGFKKYVQGGLVVNVAQTVRVDATLQLGQATETINVTAQAGQIQRDTSDRGTIVTARDVEQLPIVSQGESRNPGFYMTLAPGVTGKGTANTTPSGSGRQLNTTVNGSQSGSTEFLLDGAVIGQSYAMSGDFHVLSFPPDVVGEYNVMTLNPPAEYGQTGLGITNFTLKSGTNQFHGSAYEYLRNEKLDARGFYAAKTPLNKQNEFGATVGGPIKKDKLFFYGWYEGFRLSKEAGANTRDTLPTAAMKSGDLSNLLGEQIGTDALGRPVFAGAIYDPASTRNVTQGQVDPVTGLTANETTLIRDPFGATAANGWTTTNIIPSGRIDPVAAAMFAQFVDPPSCPTCAGGYISNWLTTYKNVDPQNQFGAKIDYNFSNSHRLTSSYTFWKDSPVTGSKWPGAISEGAIATNGRSIARLGYDWIMRPNLVNHWVLGYTRQRNDTFPAGGLDWPGKLNYSGVPPSGPGSTFPELIIGGLGNTYGRGGQGYGANNNYTLDEALTWTRGHHTIKTGFSYYRFYNNGLSTNAQSSGLIFTAGATGLPGFYNDNCSYGGACTGMGVGSFLLGVVSSGRAGVLAAPTEDVMGRYAGYIQDDYKVTSKLTMNLGLRYDLFLPTVNKKNQVSWWDPLTVDPNLGIPGTLTFASPGRRNGALAYTKAFGPRIGLAYSLNEKTVIRAGYGILYTPGMAYRSLGGLANSEGFNTTNSLQEDNSILQGFLGGTVAGHSDYHMILKNGWPDNLFAPLPYGASAEYGKGPMSFGAFPGDNRLPDIQNWHFGIQRRLRGDVILDVAYVGTKGTHLSSRLQNSNVIPTHYLTDANMLYTTNEIAHGATIDIPYVTTRNRIFQPISDPAVQLLPVVQLMPVDPATGHHAPFLGFEALYGGNATLGQALRPFPMFTTDTIQNNGQMEDEAEQTGVSSYNALQIQARKRFSQGLSFLASYTWSKTLTDSESLFNEFSGFTQDFYNRRAEKSYSLNDYPHNLVISYQYELPFGPGKKFANTGGPLGKVIGGWIIAGVHQYQSGPPQLIVTGSDAFWPYVAEKSFMNRPNVVPGVNKKSAAVLGGTWDTNAPGTAGSVYNISAWCDPSMATGMVSGDSVVANPTACSGPLSLGLQPQNYVLGNAPRTDGRARRFGYLNEDISIIKRTAITERVNIEFRADFLNIFNRTVFSWDQGGDQYGSVLQGTAIDWGVSSFGHVVGQGNFPREIQFGLKINY